MRLQNALLLGGFVLAGTLPWFTLGPASSLGIPGWSSGLAAVLAVVLGVLSCVLSALADKGMPTKSGAVGPRLAAVATALGSLVAVIVWLSTSGNTQATVGTFSTGLHYGSGAPVTIILSALIVILTGYDLITSKEQIPTSLVNAYKKASKKFSESRNRQGVSNTSPANGPQKRPANTPKTKPSPAVSATNREAPHPVGEVRSGQKTDLHLQRAPGVQSPERSTGSTPPGDGSGVPEPPIEPQGDNSVTYPKVS